MANLRTLSTLTVLLTLLFTFFTTVLANGQEPNGRILCDPTYDPHICQLRVTMYFRNFPKCNDGVSSFACFDVYDHWCKQIGTSHNNGGHASINSELPWTVEVDLPISYARIEELRGMYAGHGLWPTTNTVHCIDWDCAGDAPYTSSLYGFPC